jgi:hypothetical protein
VAIDPHQRVSRYLGKTLLARAGLELFTELVEQPSSIALPEKMRQGDRFQIAYIDGCCAAIEVFFNFYYVCHLLTEGGIALSTIARVLMCAD